MTKDDKKKVYLTRHAEKDSEGVLTGEGRKAAVALGEKLPLEDVADVICSDSLRAKETATLALINT